MQKFILKSILFLLPIVWIVWYTMTGYTDKQGDLARMSYLHITYDWRKIFAPSEFISDKTPKISQKENTKKKWKFFVIGDSFSHQRSIGYVSKLEQMYPNELLRFDRNLMTNEDPLYTLNALAKGDYFDSLKTDFVIFQSVERYIINRSKSVSEDKTLSFQEVQQSINNENIHSQTTASEIPEKESFPTDRFVKFPVNNLVYQFKSDGWNKFVFREQLNKPLFSTKRQELLFYKEDITAISPLNDSENVKHLNAQLNEISDALKAKGVQLIVLIVPDKLDLYHPYLVDQHKYSEVTFFQNFNRLPKNHINIDAFSMLRAQLEKNVKDLYLYDDTHWSPIASKLVAKEIATLSKMSKKQ